MNGARRTFLKQTLAASTLLAPGPAAPAFLPRTAAVARPGAGDTVLVVVQLAGGNDGLNTIVPYADDDYARARPTLRLSASRVIPFAPHFGFHPQMLPFERLFKDGQLSILQGIGYPNPNPGHQESMHVWQSADLAFAEARAGWIGRTADSIRRSDQATVPAAFVGTIPRPAALTARQSILPTFHTLEGAALQSSRTPGGVAFLNHASRLAEAPRDRPVDPLLQFVQKSTLASYATSRQIEEAARTRPGRTEYPSTPFAQHLSLIARLIRTCPGLRIYYTELGGVEPGGFDTHAGQALNHGALLEQLTAGVSAFVADLKRDKLLERVLLLTFSEFGRTVQENGRRGTDHGSAQPLFLVGGKVKGGLLGKHPNLTDLENGGQRHHTDFRRVYATLLERWLGFPSRPVLGQQFELLDLVQPS